MSWKSNIEHWLKKYNLLKNEQILGADWVKFSFKSVTSWRRQMCAIFSHDWIIWWKLLKWWLQTQPRVIKHPKEEKKSILKMFLNTFCHQKNCLFCWTTFLMARPWYKAINQKFKRKKIEKKKKEKRKKKKNLKSAFLHWLIGLQFTHTLGVLFKFWRKKFEKKLKQTRAKNWI